MTTREKTPAHHETRDSHAGRRVLVTGGAKGIGLAMAEAFARRGATVGVLDIDAAEVAAAVAGLPGRGVAMTGDVSDYASLGAAISAAEAEMGGAFDTLINNAGISPKHQGVAHKVWELDPDEWRRVVDVNLTGSFNCIRALTPAMVAAGETEIVEAYVIADSPRPVPPCGGCRQKLSEFARAETKVILATVSGEVLETTVGALLPGAFRPDDMDRV